MVKRFGKIFLLLIFCCYASAAVRRTCKVSYKTEDGWSSGVYKEVTFCTGLELNSATHSINFQGFEKYAMVWFSQHQVAIMEIDYGSDIIVGTEFNGYALWSAFTFQDERTATQVNDEDGRKWKIAAKEYGVWVDPRSINP
jgi:hypothetical protein